eukprot:SAG31_NODE_20668_length_568_cov_0.982942_1_plen_70_part_01
MVRLLVLNLRVKYVYDIRIPRPRGYGLLNLVLHIEGTALYEYTPMSSPNSTDNTKFKFKLEAGGMPRAVD